MNNVIVEKSKAFAVRVIKLCRILMDKNEYILSKQPARSGTSIGANVREAGESEYWLELLYETEYINQREFESIASDCKEILRILVAINKNNKNNKYNKN